MTLVRLLLSLLLVITVAPLLASDEVVRISSVKIGLDNTVKVGVPALVQVGVEASADVDGELSIVTPDPRGNPVRVVDKLALQAGKSASKDFTITLGRLETTLAVEFHSKGQLVARRRFECSESNDEADFRISRHAQPFWFIVGPLTLIAKRESNRDANAESAAKTGVKSLGQVHRTEVSSATQLPTSFEALSLYDTVLLVGEFGASDASAQTLERWVRNGGHLIAVVGSKSAELEQSPLGSWLPGKGRSFKTTKLKDLSPLVFYSQTEYPMPPANLVDGSLITYSDGESIVKTFDGELVMRFAHGFGRVTLVGIDFDKRPLVNWRGLEGLVTSLAELGSQESKLARGPERLSRTGISELQTQLHSALTRFPETTEQSVPSMLGMVLFFLLLIGPIDFVLVHKWLKRPELTWLTFPGVVLLAVLAATVTASSTRGAKVAVNQLDFVDYDSSTGHLHQTSFASIYSPENRRYSVSIEQDDRARLGSKSPLSLQWLANPEPNFGGMYRVGGFEVGKPEYSLSADLKSVSNAPVSAGSTRSWRGDIEQQVAEPLIEARLERLGVGQFSNESYFSHRFAGSIDHWMMAFAGRVYFHSVRDAGVAIPTSIAPGQRVAMSGGNVRNTELRSFLTGASYKSRKSSKKTTEEEHFHTVTKYDPTSEDLSEICRMISLHRAAGATEYTTLTNAGLQRFDLSDLTALDRAVFIGLLEVPTSQLVLDGHAVEDARRTVVVRCLIPVREPNQSSDTLPKLKKD